MVNKQLLEAFRKQVEQELLNDILPYWMNNVVDQEHEGFYGYITTDHVVDKTAPKGCILNSRILWTFSSAVIALKDECYLDMASRAYEYLLKYFWDHEYSGLYFMVDYTGKVTHPDKQIYNLAFGIYGLSEYFRATGDRESLAKAIELYRLIEAHSYDQEYHGYLEALSRTWKPIDDMRLSPKDLNAAKSMNTHLHVLEGYTNLLRVWDDPGLKMKLKELLSVFLKHVIDNETFHFKLFFDQMWNSKSDHISYGHDIEGSWLLYEAAELLNDPDLIAQVKPVIMEMAQRVYAEGIDHRYGGIFNEGQQQTITDSDKHWWVQAEAVVGFLNAYEISGREYFYETAYQVWNFITTYLIDRKYGEWFWKVAKNGKPYFDQPKVEPWKCPYHNSRTCLEVIVRLGRIMNKREI